MYVDVYGKPDGRASFAKCILPFVQNHSSFGKCLRWDFEHCLSLSLCKFHFSFVRNSKCRLHIAFFPTDLVNFTSENLKCTSQKCTSPSIKSAIQNVEVKISKAQITRVPSMMANTLSTTIADSMKFGKDLLDSNGDRTIADLRMLKKSGPISSGSDLVVD